MPISVTCSGCGQKLKAKDSLAGRTLPCPKCRAKISLPASEEDAAADLLLGPASATPNAPKPKPRVKPVVARPESDDSPAATPTIPKKQAKPSAATLNPIRMNEPPVWLRHLHWLLVLALIPLAVSLLQERDSQENFFDRIARTLDKSSRDVRARADHVVKGLVEGNGTLEDLFAVLPDRRVEGALLARDSGYHWLFAAVAAVGFLVFLMLLASYQTEGALRLVWIALFTATVGIAFLLIVQQLATWSHYISVRGASIVTIFILIAKFIGFSYQAALDPENGFMLSFLGYTFGVGFCEEVCKALPVLWRYRQPTDLGWRDAFLWGLASGAGFGIAEGIMYSANYYNGIAPGGIYVVRFVSCVALHALWTGSVAITVQQNQHLLHSLDSWYEIFPPLFRYVGVPMLLHGLYDTLLKKEMQAYALLVAVLSFLFLAFQISRLHTGDDQREHEAMLREYKKRRKAMT